jgi:hypothetical protein
MIAPFLESALTTRSPKAQELLASCVSPGILTSREIENQQKGMHFLSIIESQWGDAGGASSFDSWNFGVMSRKDQPTQ